MSGIPPVPAPWNLKGRIWLFALSGISKTSSLPAGFADANEAEAAASGGEFIGGVGMMQVVSYAESPVGRYDELIYIPGKWKYADGSVGYRITRIYVSSRDSVENGRRNWNIPKHLAEFKINLTDGGITSISVSHPGASTPFFQVDVKSIPLLSSLPLPFHSCMTLDPGFIQPPLPPGEKPEEVETKEWLRFLLTMKGILRVVKVTPGSEGKIGDGSGFPAVIPWSVGGYIGEMSLDCPPSSVFQIRSQ